MNQLNGFWHIPYNGWYELNGPFFLYDGINGDHLPVPHLVDSREPGFARDTYPFERLFIIVSFCYGGPIGQTPPRRIPVNNRASQRKIVFQTAFEHKPSEPQ